MPLRLQRLPSAIQNNNKNVLHFEFSFEIFVLLCFLLLLFWVTHCNTNDKFEGIAKMKTLERH
jgi:uncharacterized Tic20 family protein